MVKRLKKKYIAKASKYKIYEVVIYKFATRVVEFYFSNIAFLFCNNLFSSLFLQRRKLLSGSAS